MARIDTLSHFLTDVAEAIRTKSGVKNTISASQFDTEILNLPSQGEYQSKSVVITENGEQIIEPDTGFDAIEQLTITTNVPVKQLQTKSYTFTENTNMTLTPEIGYDGFEQVGITINVPEGTDTSDATATADEIRRGRTAYVKGEKITGTLEFTKNSNNPITNGANPVVTYDGTNLLVDRTYGKALLLERDQQIRSTVSNDMIANLGGITPDKVKKGETIYGVEGTAEGGIDTSDATVTENDMPQGVTAYAKGEKITGVLDDYRDGRPYVKTNPAVFIDTTEEDRIAFMTNGDNIIMNTDTVIRLSVDNEVLLNAIGLTADKIKAGETILGITGTYDGAISQDEVDTAVDTTNDILGI